MARGAVRATVGFTASRVADWTQLLETTTSVRGTKTRPGRSVAKLTMTNKNINQTIEKYDWAKLFISTGDARSIPERICGLISAANEPEAKHWYFLLEDYVVVQGGVYEAALPSIDLLITALKYCTISGVATAYIYELFYQILHGVADVDAIRRGNCFEVDKCKELVGQNLELLRCKCTPEAVEILNLILKELPHN
jgi:hypothetical protein